MSQLTSVSIPLGYTLTITPAVDSAGSYWSIGNPGDQPSGYVAFAAGDAAIVIGPFDLPKTYMIQSNDAPAAYAFDRALVGNDALVLLPYAPLASPTFTGVPVLPVGFKLAAVTNTTTGTELNYVHGVTSAIQTQLTANASAITSEASTARAAEAGRALIGSTVIAPIANDADGTVIATAVNGVITALIAAGILHIS